MEENEKSPLETIPPVLTEAEPKTGSPLRTFLGVLAGLILVLLLIVVLAFTFLSRQFDKAVQPIQEVNNRLSTQVSQFLHPTPTILPDPVSIVREVQSLARLETIQYSVEKVITAELNQGAFGSLFGDRLLFVAHGYVIAGVDLSKMTEDDLRIVGETLRVKLPEAEVFVATLDNDKSYVYDRDTGLLRRADTQLESAARRAAEAEILRTATEDGILAQAQTNAKTYLLSLLNSLGFSRVVFE
jgi:hypothetical protein